MVSRRRLLQGDIAIVTSVLVGLEEDLVKVADCEPLCALEVKKTGRVPLRHGDDARRIILHDHAVDRLTSHSLQQELERDQILLTAMSNRHCLRLGRMHRGGPLLV
eukprot:12064191-Heterocapsa_arctica.AAC.1